MKKITAVLICLCLLSFYRVSAVSTSAKGAAVINGDTGEVIYSQNADKRLPMASTTKIMTALILCEQNTPEKEVTVTEEMARVEGSSMGLLPGDRVTYHDLLYGLMLASGNDAANTVAIAIAGSTEKFAGLMNEKARELGLKDTNFVTPSGLDAEEHYTTAYELALLSAYALKNESFAEAAATEKAVLNYGNPPYRRSLTNHNKLLKMTDIAVGVKTGFTKKSGRCLVSAAREDGKTVVAVTLNDPNDWSDHLALLRYGLDSVIKTEYSPKASSYNLPVIGGTEDTLTVFIEPFTVNTAETANITSEVHLPGFLYAPIEKGERLGKIVYKVNGETIGEAELLSLKAIPEVTYKPDFLTVIKQNIKFILKNI